MGNSAPNHNILRQVIFMAKTNWQDPSSGEILSTHISGLQEAVGKIEKSIGTETVSETTIPLSEVFISNDDRCRIYQAPDNKRNWVISPIPVIKKNGTIINSDFTIDYGGGAVIFTTPILESDVIAADATYTTAFEGKQLSTEDYSTEEKDKLEGIETQANKYTHPVTHPASMIVLADSTDVETKINEIESDFESHLSDTVQKFEDVYSEIESSGLNKTREVDTATLYIKAIEEINSIPLDSLSQSKKSINETNSLKAAFVGTSITEGSDLNNPLFDGYFGIVSKKIKEILTPKGVTVTCQNFSLAGRTLSAFESPSYQAVNPEPVNISLGFWRTWATEGKSWREHLKDFEPDVLAFEFGMNDPSGSDPDYTFKINLDSIIAYINTWTKIPDIVLMPTILPTKNPDYSSQGQEITNAVARATREYGKEKGFIIADANRLLQILRDGKDELSTQTIREDNFAYFPINWVGSVENFTLSGNTLIPDNGLVGVVISRDKKYFNGKIDIDIYPTGGTGWISYRASSLGKMSLLVVPGSFGTASISLYSITSGSTLIDTTSGLTIPNDEFTNIRIEFDGINHKIYINGGLQINTTTYRCLHDGLLEIGSVDSSVPAFANLRISFIDAITFNPIYTELQLFGEYNNVATDGNAINHLTPLGNNMVLVPPFGFIKEMANRKESGLLLPSKILSGAWTPTASPFPTTTLAGEKLYYYVFTAENYNKKRGMILQRLDNSSHYTLSYSVVNMPTLENLEHGKFGYYADGVNDLLFISVPAAGSVTWDINCYKYK